MGHHCCQIQHDSFLSFPLGVELCKYQFLTKQRWRDRPAGVTETGAVRSDWSQKTSLSSVLASTLRRRHTADAKEATQLER